MFKLPKCRCCNRPWLPAMDVTASQGYCRKCRKERREAARQALDLHPITAADLDGPYLLPRRHRVV
jgi:hypothetical protein